MDDGQLIEAAASGDEEAFAALYWRHRGYVLALSIRFGVTGDESLDILQETFIRVAKHLKSIRNSARFTTFLYPVVKHLCIRRKRKGARLLFLGGTAEIEVLVPPDDPADPLPPDIRSLVASLPSHQREVVLLRFADDLSLEEIAEALAIPLGTVKSRLHLALAALRRALETTDH
jgi:RNA polymerase sigma-70 factor (ECF subfamily)